MLWPQQDGLLVRAFDFDTVGFDAGIVFERLVNNAAIEGVERFQFNHVTPAAALFGAFFGLFNQTFTSLSSVAADIHHDFWGGWVALKQQPVSDVLKVG